jgi:hypothetical protein
VGENKIYRHMADCQVLSLSLTSADLCHRLTVKTKSPLCLTSFCTEQAGNITGMMGQSQAVNQI